MQPNQPMQQPMPAPMQPPYGGMPAAPMPPAPSGGGGGGGGVSKVLSAIALALALVALAVNFVVAGPTGPAGTNGTNGTNGIDGSQGPQGPPGPRGPQGNGTLMAYGLSSPSQAITTTCAQVTGLQVTITVPTTGTIVVDGWASVDIIHNAGTRDNYWFKAVTDPTDCIADNWLTLVTYDAALASTSIWPTVTPQRIVPVTAGTYTFYFTMIRQSGISGDLRYATLTAVFYPS